MDDQPTLDALIDFAEAASPGFRADLVGARASHIQELAALAGHPLPPIYLDFLYRMGLDIGAARLLAADYSLDSIVSRYEVYEPSHPRRFVLFAITTGELFEDYYIDFQATAARDGPVVAFDFESSAPAPRPVFRSFYDHLLAAFYRQFELERLPHAHHVHLPAGPRRERASLNRAEALLARLGFATVLAGDAGVRALRATDASALVSDLPGTDNLLVELAGADPRVLARLHEVLGDNWRP